MTYQAIWNGQVVAEAEDKDTIRIEGNIYFPPDSLKRDFFAYSSTTTECVWKGTANYYNLLVDGKENPDAAWYYHQPKESAVQIVSQGGKYPDFKDYVAFWKGVEVKPAKE